MAWVAFATFAALYAASAGARGYSVDGDFAYRLARDAVTRGPVEALRAQRELLRRWGVGLPLVGAPFVAAAAALAPYLPPAGSFPLDAVPGATGTLVVPLADLPPISVDATNGPGDPTAFDLPIPPGTAPVTAVTVVSSLAFGTGLKDGTEVATVAVIDAAGMPVGPPVPLRAGFETAEWSWGDPARPPVAHRLATVAGRWDGNAAARHYRATVPVVTTGAAGKSASVRIAAIAPTGRLLVKAVVVSTADGASPIVTSPAAGLVAGATTTADRVTRAAFGFANVLPGAATVALLVPIAAAFGATPRAALLLAIATGVATLAWPYARLDFTEMLAAAGATAAFAARLAAARAATPRRALALNVAAGALAIGAGVAKYTALWFGPLVAADAILRPGALKRAHVAALFLGPALGGAAVAFGTGLAAPTIIAELPDGLARGWLGFPLWAGLLALLVSSGKGLIWYSPPLALAAGGMIAFVRRHGVAAFLPVAASATYLVVFGSKGNWHGGGWGPRYVVPMVPLAMVLSLPVLALATGGPSRWRLAARGAVVLAIAAGTGVQAIGVLKHPNAYAIMFRDHLAPQVPEYGAAQGGALARAHVEYFRQGKAPSELLRPPGVPVDVHGTPLPARGLGHLIDRDSPLVVKVWPSQARRFALTLYFCDYDGLRDERRHQNVTVTDGREAETVRIEDFAGGVYVTWVVDALPGEPVSIVVHDSGRAFPVVTGLFFDPAPPGDRPFPVLDRGTGGAWIGRYGHDGAILPAYEMGPRDAGAMPGYVHAVTGGIPLWVDTGELERSEAALLFAPGFSPILAHAWLLGNDLVATAFPADGALRQRALASPPWRYVHGLEVHSPHPEFGLGIDLWPLAMSDWFASWPRVVAAVWAIEGAFVAIAFAGAMRLAVEWRRASPPGAEDGS